VVAVAAPGVEIVAVMEALAVVEVVLAVHWELADPD
jgi:hypothetical protein